jgi:hypothetical protein
MVLHYFPVTCESVTDHVMLTETYTVSPPPSGMPRLPTLPDRYGRATTRLLQGAIVVILLFGVWVRNPSIVVNGVLALAVTFLPAVLERDYRISASPWLVAFITTAVFLHSLGMVGLYDGLWWFDHLTHTLSASIVAGVGYAAVKAIDEYSDAVRLTPRFTFVLVLTVTLALGVLWEVLEFSLRVLARSLGMAPVLVQYGIEDTLADLVFDLVGGLVAALFGTGVYDEVAETFRERLEDYREQRFEALREGSREAAAGLVSLATVVRDTRRNARVAWAVVVLLVGLVAVELLSGSALRGTFTAAVVVLAVLPPAVYRSSRVMLPWWLLVLVAVPGVVYEFAGPGPLSEFATHVAVAAVALVIAVELQLFTSVQMSPRFAVGFVVVTTMAAEGLWALVRWASDLWLGTSFLLGAGPELVVEEALMWGFVYSTVAGLLAGLAFEWGFRRRAARAPVARERAGLGGPGGS